MNKNKKKMYPSQERYLERNPSVSFRLPKDQYEKLEEIAKREGKTKGQYVREYLTGVVAEREKEDEIFDKGFDEGYEEGYDEGEKDWKIGFKCYICGKPAYIKPNSEAHRVVIKCMFQRYWHASCSEKKQEKASPKKVMR